MLPVLCWLLLLSCVRFRSHPSATFGPFAVVGVAGAGAAASLLLLRLLPLVGYFLPSAIILMVDEMSKNRDSPWQTDLGT